MTEIYSNLKAAWHLQDIKALRDGKDIVPHHVYLVISDRCNHDCHFCTYRSSAGWGSENFGADTGQGFTMNPNRRIPRDKCFEILEDCASLGVKAIQFTGGGEPTVHPDHEAIFARTFDLGLQAGMVTNGTNIPWGLAASFTWIRISVDAGRRETYERTRKAKHWNRVLSAIERLSGIEGPSFGTSFVVTRENYREVAEFCSLMKSLGVPYVKISANLTHDGLSYYDGILDEIMELMSEAKELAGEGFRIVSVFERRLEDLRIGRPSHPFCGQQRFSTYIGGDQKVYRCCNTGYTSHGEIGDLSGQSFRQWFENESPKAFDGFDARSCVHCQFIEKNEATAYLVQKNPAHVDFI